VICPACSKELPGEFPFCPFCAARLTAAAPAASLEERKVVSVLFCDLVGFTAASEAVDPEDVRARLRPYHARVRDVIEGHGGTVEKFVGDAIMAVFGAPVAHEDDAERAVRAALQVLDAVEELNASQPQLELRVRIGINTGETLVDRAARAQLGESVVAGDVVNTAARLQSGAPVGGIAAGELTHLHTRRLFDYEPLEPVQAKGKAMPLVAWQPVAAARLDDDSRTPFVGRRAELDRLRRAFELATGRRRSRFVTVVGEAGIGKSRLILEFRDLVEGLGAVWRQGRCLPYGDGIAFWALGEIVKVHAGIYEGDGAETATEKLEAVLPTVDERPWLRTRLLPLIGVDPGQPPSRAESFAAWRLFLQAIATDGSVAVIEDLHWADLAFLEFLTDLADRSGDVPLLVVCTTRSDLYERVPDWPEKTDGCELIELEPLSSAETSELVGGLVVESISEATRELVLERANGNPLYAEEIVRLLADRELPAGGAAPIPDSLQALIAARLDTLPVDEKSLLQDAAVVGHTFSASAVEAIGGRSPEDVDRALRDMVRKELIRPAVGRSLEDEPEYAFWHILIRDVAYAQIPRNERARRHLAAAHWFVESAGERVADLAELVAHHYLAALDVQQALGLDGDRATLEREAIRYLLLASERAIALDVASAERSLARALELAGADDAQRPLLLERWADAAAQQGRVKEAQQALVDAVQLYRERDEQVALARALRSLSWVLQRLGDPRREETLSEALAILEGQPAGPEHVAAYAALASRRYVGSAYRESLAAAEKALALADELGVEAPINALAAKGGSRANLGDPGGLADIRRALEIAIAAGNGLRAAVTYSNYAIDLHEFEGLQPALDACTAGIEFAERCGITLLAQEMLSQKATYLRDLGRTDEALTLAGEAAAHSESVGDVPGLLDARSVELRVLAERGLAHGKRAEAEELIVIARTGGEPQQLAAGLACGALLYRDDPARAKELLRELAETPGTRSDQVYVTHLPELVRGAVAVGDGELAADLVGGVDATVPLFQHVLCMCRAQLGEADGDLRDAAQSYAEAAERWRAFGRVTELAHALLGLGRCLLSLGGTADSPLMEARDLFTSMGYKPAIGETERLLAEATVRTA
jgi:class 3 adenylate cyclase/tetratricopeptide (TPR) repeat protein